MKRIISVLLAVLMLFSLAGCQKASPQKDLDAMLMALKSGDMETLAALNDGEVFDLEGQEQMMSIFSSISWKFGETVEVDEDDAKVNVQITTKDMQTVFSEFMTQALSKALQGEEMSEEAVSQMLIDIINATEKTASFDVAVEMSLEDGKWVIDDDGNEEFFNAITGGLMNVMAEYENMLK